MIKIEAKEKETAKPKVLTKQEFTRMLQKYIPKSKVSGEYENSIRINDEEKYLGMAKGSWSVSIETEEYKDNANSDLKKFNKYLNSIGYHTETQKDNSKGVSDSIIIDMDETNRKETSKIKVLSSKSVEVAYGFRNFSEMRNYFTPGDKFTISKIKKKSGVNPVKELKVGSTFTVSQISNSAVWFKPKRGNQLMLEAPTMGLAFYKDVDDQGFTKVTDDFEITYQRV